MNLMKNETIEIAYFDIKIIFLLKAYISLKVYLVINRTINQRKTMFLSVYLSNKQILQLLEGRQKRHFRKIPCK